MSDNQSKKQHSTPSPEENPVQETLEEPPVVVAAPTFLSPPPPSSHYVLPESINPKRPRYTSVTGQWKLLPSPTSQKQNPINVITTDKTPSPSTNPTASSTSDTTSPPSHSPRPSVSGQETNKPSELEHQYTQHQLRKGKYVSPVWKPNEMLWLARAWRIQYQSGANADSSGTGSRTDHAPVTVEPNVIETVQSHQHGRGKTRAAKDREVAEFLQRNGVNRDAKTAGTKWDNMLGEFRKVYEWERGGEREQIGKSYFRLSPYERKLHRLPASFDEQVFEELSQFMGSRMRTLHNSGCRGTSPFLLTSADQDSRLPIVDTKSFPYPSLRDDDTPLSSSGRGGRHMMMAAAGGGGGGEGYIHGVRGRLLGIESSSMEVVGGGQYETSSSSTLKELRRIGKVRMVWEEHVSLWAEDGEHHRGRVKVQGTSFLNADELTFLDDAMVACTLESFEDLNSPLKGFSVDRFLPGQQVKVFGRRKSTHPPGLIPDPRPQASSLEPSNRSISSWEFQDLTEYYLGCLHVPPPSLPTLIDLPWYLQEPPPEQFRFPVRKDLYRDLPQGKELFFTTSSEPLDCRSITFEILSPIVRSNPTLTSTTRESFIGLWDDCINRVVSKFNNLDMAFIRKPSHLHSNNGVQDQWPNVTGFVRNLCLWRGEETDRLREDNSFDPSSLLVQKLLWSYVDLPYILGYYAVGYIVTFCALSRTHDHTLIRTNLHTVDLATPGDRIKALVPCWRIAGLLSLLADRCANMHNDQQVTKSFLYSDFERIDLGNDNVIELTPNYMTRVFLSKRKWVTVKEIYDFLDHRIPHSEYICQSSERDLSLSFKPRGCKLKLSSFEQLVEALKHVTKALVVLHDLSFMHRDLGWDKVMRRSDRDNEWFVIGFDEAASAPQIYPPQQEAGAGSELPPTSSLSVGGRHAPEIKGRGMHGVKVDVWGVGQMLKTCGLVGLPKPLKELQNRCLDQNPEHRPTAADCYHHLLQLQSSMSADY